MKKYIFLTGVTGELGRYFVELFLKHTDKSLCFLVRGNKDFSAQERFRSVLSENLNHEEYKKYSDRFVVFNGDISLEDFGLNLAQIDFLKKNVTEVLHVAAITGFRLPWDLAYNINVCGTRRLLNFFSKVPSFKHFHYISTAFIIGNKDHQLRECDLDLDQGFNNTYEKSKYEAELEVERFRKMGMKISVYRPSIVIGNYKTGCLSNFKLFFETLKIFSREIFDKIPVDLEVEHNLIPADVAARMIFLLYNEGTGPRNYHICYPQSIKCFDFMDKAANFFGYKNPKWIPAEDFNASDFTPVQRQMMNPFIPYFSYRGRFSMDVTYKILKRHNFEFPLLDDAFFDRVFTYCDKSNYIKVRR